MCFVLQNAKEVRCTWAQGHFNSKVLFKNPHYDQAFDIAILEVPDDQKIPAEYFTVCETNRARTGKWLLIECNDQSMVPIPTQLILLN